MIPLRKKESDFLKIFIIPPFRQGDDTPCLSRSLSLSGGLNFLLSPFILYHVYKKSQQKPVNSQVIC